MASVTNNNRLTGMFSGIDTDALVKSMVSTQQAKIDKVNQSKSVLEWKKTAYTDFNEQLRALKEEYSSVMGKNSLLSKSAFFNYSISGELSSAVSVKTTAGAKTGQYNIAVKQVAKAASIESSKLTTSTTGLTSTQLEKTSISNLTDLANGSFKPNASGEIRFTINDKEFTFSEKTTLKNIMETVNKANIGVKMEYSQITDKMTITSATSGAYKQLESVGEAPVKPEAFSETQPNRADFDNQEKYDEALATYKEKLDYYNTNVGQPYKDEYAAWTSASKAYEANQKKTITFDDTDGFLAQLGMTSVTEGQNAIVSINGGAEQEQESNEFTLDGIAFTINGATGEKPVSFNVSKSSAESLDKIKSFIETFNGLISSFYTATNEKKNYSYKPLTDEQRAELSDDEIAAWETKAKAGIMKNDRNLDKFLTTMRTALSSQLGDGKLSDIGISVSKYEVGKPWKLEIDETKLTAALESDPEKVYNMFANSEDTEGMSMGLIAKLNKATEDFSSFTKTNNIQDLTNQISKHDKSISALQTKMDTLSEKYYLQYASLETSLAKMQSQQSQMSSLFGTSSS